MRIRITPTLRKQINAKVRSLCGANPLAEVGLRGEHHGANALNWTDEDDLWDLRRLADTKEIDGHEAQPGCAVLDLYVTSGTGMDRELEGNVYVFIRDGKVVYATAQDRAVRADATRLGFNGNGWITA